MSPVAEWGLIIAGGKREGLFLPAGHVLLSDIAAATTHPIPLLGNPPLEAVVVGRVK